MHIMAASPPFLAPTQMASPRVSIPPSLFKFPIYRQILSKCISHSIHMANSLFLCTRTSGRPFIVALTKHNKLSSNQSYLLSRRCFLSPLMSFSTSSSGLLMDPTSSAISLKIFVILGFPETDTKAAHKKCLLMA